METNGKGYCARVYWCGYQRAAYEAPTIEGAMIRAEEAARRHWHLATIDIRGSYTSDGTFHPLYGGRVEAHFDGYRWHSYTYASGTCEER